MQAAERRATCGISAANVGSPGMRNVTNYGQESILLYLRRANIHRRGVNGHSKTKKKMENRSNCGENVWEVETCRRREPQRHIFFILTGCIVGLVGGPAWPPCARTAFPWLRCRTPPDKVLEAPLLHSQARARRGDAMELQTKIFPFISDVLELGTPVRPHPLLVHTVVIAPAAGACMHPANHHIATSTSLHWPSMLCTIFYN